MLTPHRFITGCLDWLTANLDSFELPSQEDDEAAGEAFIELRRKAFGELALAVMLMSRDRAVRATPQFGRMLDYVESRVRAPEYAFNMARRPNLFPFYVTILVGLEACGRSFPEQRFMIQRVLDFGLMDRIERSAWHQLDLRYYLDRGNFRHRLPGYGSLYRSSSIRELPPIPHLRGIDVYALTHMLFYMADFGRRDLRPILDGGFERTREEVALLLGTYVREQDWDMVAELLICCRCLDHCSHPLFELAWKGLLGAQRPDGALPLRTFDPESPELADPEKAERYQFINLYHTTLVGLFAAVLESQREHDC
ncbi:MAG TPA: hypothetical protein VKB93_11695 [Thermoanaerobaculia bacterium]|nr:hypothetical protein [Thermoanaerobaculia bacterium]